MADDPLAAEPEPSAIDLDRVQTIAEVQDVPGCSELQVNALMQEVLRYARVAGGGASSALICWPSSGPEVSGDDFDRAE